MRAVRKVLSGPSVFEGEISLIDPFIDETKRTAKVRIDIPNPDRKLRPGMYLNIELAMDMGEGLTIPVSAVMPTGSAHARIRGQRRGQAGAAPCPTRRQIRRQLRSESGLIEGERVVSSANFLIDAESKVQGAVKSFERENESANGRIGEAAMGGHPGNETAKGRNGETADFRRAQQKNGNKMR